MQKGFTLVELSIVLVIIGLLIGGILVGQSLIESVKINGTIREHAQYEIAIRMFHSRYKQLPGDSTKASTALGVGSGNGDNLIGNTNEAYWAWRQLSLSRLINNNADTLDGHYSGTHTAGIVENGINAPISNVFQDAVWTLYTTSNNYGYIGSEHQNGIHIRIGQRQVGQGGSTNPRPFVGPLTTTLALAIDAKQDDGKPGSGNLGHYRNGHSQMFDCSDGSDPNTAEYNLDLEGDLCHMAFWLPDF